MPSALKFRPVVAALSVNAALLLLILLSVILKDYKGLGTSAAYGQIMNGNLAPGSSASLSVMPCQLSQNTWGCYMVDNYNQTLCVYQYLPGQDLRLLAARDIQYDRRLASFNTSPAPKEIRALVERADEAPRSASTTNRSPEIEH